MPWWAWIWLAGLLWFYALLYDNGKG